MELFQHFSAEILAGICVALLSALVVFLYKLPSTLKDLNEFMRESKEEHKEHSERLSVHDSLWSAELDQVIDSRMISKGKMPFPIKTRKPQREQ